MDIIKAVSVALWFFGESNLLVDILLNYYVYDKLCDSNLELFLRPIYAKHSFNTSKIIYIL